MADKTISISDSLRREFDHEAASTRAHLARLPHDQWGWRPHEKSFAAGALASHLVECLGWGEAIFAADEFNVNPNAWQPYQAASLVDLLRDFDERAAQCRQALASMDDEMLWQPWQLKIMGRVRFERPRLDAFRDMTLSHLIHHRGQLSVYLRLLNVAVPGSYGPTADEQG
jgi:uncharacterized damage-inducible protein DinB